MEKTKVIRFTVDVTSNNVEFFEDLLSDLDCVAKFDSDKEE